MGWVDDYQGKEEGDGEKMGPARACTEGWRVEAEHTLPRAEALTYKSSKWMHRPSQVE
jgi:hypothetical protein